jgi:voltage-dependent anion channel protein 2
MSNPGLYKDLNKRNKDFLTKEFPGDNKITVKSKTAHGVSFEVEVVNGAKGNKGTFKPKYKWASLGNVEVSAEVNTDRLVKSEIAITDELVQGLKVTIGGQSTGKEVFATVAGEYSHEHFTLTGGFDYGKDEGSTIDASLLAGHGGFVFGGDAAYAVKDQALKAHSVSAGYKAKDFDVIAYHKATSKDKTVGVAYYHQLNEELSVGSDVSMDLQQSDKTSLKLAAQWNATADSTFKGAYSTNGQLQFSYQQKFNPRVKGTLGATVDTASGKNNATTFGATLALTD